MHAISHSTPAELERRARARFGSAGWRQGLVTHRGIEPPRLLRWLAGVDGIP